MSEENVKAPVNTWDQVGEEGVFISKEYSHGMTPYFNGWNVIKRGEGSFRSNKWFSTFGDNDRGMAALARAKAWAEEQFGPKKWKRNSMGDYVDASLPPLRKRKP